MGRVNKNIGANAVVSIPWKSIRPLSAVKEAHPNDYLTTRGEFVVVGLERDRSFDGVPMECLTLMSEDAVGVELFCKAEAAKLLQKGPPNQVFNLQSHSPQTDVGLSNIGSDPALPPLPLSGTSTNNFDGGNLEECSDTDSKDCCTCRENDRRHLAFR